VRGALRRGRYAHARYERATSGGTYTHQRAPNEHYVCAAHYCLTRFVNSRQEHAIDALRAFYFYQASSEIGCFTRVLHLSGFYREWITVTRVLHSIYIQGVGLLYAPYSYHAYIEAC